jgi:hypothetical protein
MTGESCESGFLIRCAVEKDESFPAHTAHTMGARALRVVAMLGPIWWFDFSSGTGQPATVKPMMRVATNELSSVASAAVKSEQCTSMANTRSCQV